MSTGTTCVVVGGGEIFYGFQNQFLTVKMLLSLNCILLINMRTLQIVEHQNALSLLHDLFRVLTLQAGLFYLGLVFISQTRQIFIIIDVRFTCHVRISMR